MTKKHKAAFLDRDGVLNLDKGYIYKISDFEWIPGAIDAIGMMRDAGYKIVVVTNQSGIGRGYYTEADMYTLHNHIQNKLIEVDLCIDNFYFCPFHPEAVVDRFRADHPNRKPKPGMILDASNDMNISLEKSFMVGDKDTDMQAANAAGVAGYKFKGGRLDDFVQRILIERR